MDKKIIILVVTTLSIVITGLEIPGSADIGNVYESITKIYSSRDGKTVSYNAMMKDLASARVVYLGESHTDMKHHELQLAVLKDLNGVSRTGVAMEMFSVNYDPVLREWSAGNLAEEEFLMKSHWYANWKYHYRLYRGILDFVKENRLPLAGLNVPFHIPRKVSLGGLDNLLPEHRKYVPDNVDLTNRDHREYVRRVFEGHSHGKLKSFEFFYQAQCLWEDAMAASVALNSKQGRLAVIIGNGHIYKKFGVPDRAFRRNGQAFRTVYPVTGDREVESDAADYIVYLEKKE